jgi:hypothetical protein
MITISHSPAEGTLVDGTAKGDGSAPIIKLHRFTWFPSIKKWGVRNSRDKAAPVSQIESLAQALREAGFDVEVAIEKDERSFAEAEADRYGRAQDRAERNATYAEAARGRAATAQGRADQIADVIPMGQPILRGHHSEGRHRRDLGRIESGMRQAIEETRHAEGFEHRAGAAAKFQERREDVPTTLRRIERLETELRDIDRKIERGADGVWLDQLSFRRGQLTEEIGYWQAHVEAAKETGVKVWGPSDFKKGDHVQTRFGWHEVLRVNKKSLTVPTPYSWTETVPYDRVIGHRAGDTIPQIEGLELDGGAQR